MSERGFTNAVNQHRDMLFRVWLFSLAIIFITSFCFTWYYQKRLALLIFIDRLTAGCIGGFDLQITQTAKLATELSNYQATIAHCAKSYKAQHVVVF